MKNNGWTEERRRKQSNAIKRWKPWEKSKGAITQEGRDTSKMNALKHGAYGAEMKRLQALLGKIKTEKLE